MAAANPLQNLLEEASCPICLGPFKDPVITPCIHNFCRSCITGCSKEPGGTLCCPQCREPCSLADLKPNRQLQSIVELVNQLSAQPQRPPMGGCVCVEHAEGLKLFCQDDRKLICVICQVSSEHQGHRVRPVGEAARDYQGKLENCLPPLQKERDAIVVSKQKKEEESKNMRGNLQAERMKATAEFERLRQLLREQEQTILKRLEEMEGKITMVENANIAKLSNQISSLNNLIKEIETKCEQSPEELLKDVELLLSRCENKFQQRELKIKKTKWKDAKIILHGLDLPKGIVEGDSQYVNSGLLISTPQHDVQKSVLYALLKKPLHKGDEWYLIDSRWFKQWKKYVGYDTWDMHNMGDCKLYPGPIDNSGLFSDCENQDLKEHLIDELDYMLVPMEAWEKLVSWYGCVKGQRPIVRKVIKQGLFAKHCKVEVYLLKLKLCENRDLDNLKTWQFSKADTIESIEKQMRHLFKIPNEKKIRLWNKYMSNTFEQLSKPESTAQDAGLYQGQLLVIEQQNEDGTWSRQTQQMNTLSDKG